MNSGIATLLSVEPAESKERSRTWFIGSHSNVCCEYLKNGLPMTSRKREYEQETCANRYTTSDRNSGEKKQSCKDERMN